MNRYRLVMKCEHCGKVFSNYWCDIYEITPSEKNVCPKCGEYDYFRIVIAKPKFFRLLGWNIKEKK